MKPARLILLLVALVAGGLAAFLVTRGGGSAPEQIVTTEVVQEAKTQILVASVPIGMGERLSPATVQWQDWPEGAIRPEYVTIGATPDAPTELTGAVARFEFFPGEPIREAKLVRSDQGYLSAVLAEGMRGVSVGVSAESGAGGFIVPNDRVDVVLTTQGSMGQQSEVILSDVRVLAIGARLGEMGASGGQSDPSNPAPTPAPFEASTIATLELTPRQSETLVNATSLGQLALTLRSVANFNKVSPIDQGGSQTVRLIRFGREQSVQSGSTGPMLAQQPVAIPNATLPVVSAPAVEPQIAPQLSAPMASPM